MPAVKRNRSHPDNPAFEKTRAKIRTTQLVNRLEKHALGEKIGKKVVELSTTQVAAIKILLDKSVPNLQSTEVVAKVESQAWMGPPPKSAEEWEEEHGETKH